MEEMKEQETLFETHLCALLTSGVTPPPAGWKQNCTLRARVTVRARFQQTR